MLTFTDRSNAVDEYGKWIEKICQMTMFDKMLRRATRVMIAGNRLILRKPYIYGELTVLREYGYNKEEVERIHYLLVSRFAVPVTLLSCSPVLVPLLVAPVLGLVSVFFEIKVDVVYYALLLSICVVFMAKIFSAGSRVLLDIRMILAELVVMRRCHMVGQCFAPSGVVFIDATRARVKRALQTRSRSLRKNVARAAGRESGEPGFEQCEYLAMWLYWASEDLDDETRVHRAIRVCAQMLQHYAGPTAWLIPEVAKPPARASVAPPTAVQRLRATVAKAIQAGSLTAVFGLLTAMITLTVKFF